MGYYIDRPQDAADRVVGREPQGNIEKGGEGSGVRGHHTERAAAAHEKAAAAHEKAAAAYKEGKGSEKLTMEAEKASRSATRAHEASGGRVTEGRAGKSLSDQNAFRAQGHSGTAAQGRMELVGNDKVRISYPAGDKYLASDHSRAADAHSRAASYLRQGK